MASNCDVHMLGTGRRCGEEGLEVLGNHDHTLLVHVVDPGQPQNAEQARGEDLQKAVFSDSRWCAEPWVDHSEGMILGWTSGTVVSQGYCYSIGELVSIVGHSRVAH